MLLVSRRSKEVFSGGSFKLPILTALRILGMSWGVKTACFKAPGVSLGGSGVSIGGVRILREGTNNVKKSMIRLGDFRF